MTLIVFSSLVETPIPPTDSYFTSDYELGVTDGSAQGSIIPIDSKGDTTPTNVAYLTNLGNEVLFEANDGVNGRQLWETNGTAGGTKLVKIINSTGDAFSDPGNQSPGSSQIGMIAIGSDVYFAANDGSGRNELWKSDGSDTGTTLVKSFNADTTASTPSDFVDFNGSLYFVANGESGFVEGTSPGGPQIWKSDGSSTGTVQVTSISPSASAHPSDGPAGPFDLTVAGNNLFFVWYNGNDYDPTNTDEQLYVINSANPTGALLDPSVAAVGGAQNLTAINGELYFSQNDGTHGYELWKSDGTAAGTMMVDDINPETASNPAGSNAPGSSPSDFVSFNSEVYFIANDGTHGRELWKTDGTKSGTSMVFDLNTTSESAGTTEDAFSNGDLTAIGNELFFVATNGDSDGFQLWETDGSLAGTHELTSHTTGGGTNFTGVTELENIGGALYFAAEDGNTETGLWKWNGEEAVFVTSNYNYGNGGNSYVAIAPPTPPTAVEESGVVLSGQTLAGTAGTSGASTGALSGDSGAGTLSISAVSVDGGSAGVVGESLAGTYGHLTLNANGSYSYSADNAGAISNAPAGVLTDTFDFTVSSSNGGTATSNLTISIVGQRVTVSELKTYAALINASAGFQVTVIDTAAKIAAALTSLESEASHIGSIETTDTAVTVGVAALPSDQTALDKIVGGFAVSDTAAHITASLDHLNDANLKAITISDNKSIGLDVAQLTSDATAIGKLANANSSPVSLVVTDAVPAVQNGLSTLAGAFASKITSITTTGSGHVTVNKATFVADESTLNKITSGFVLSDTAANIQAELSALKTDVAHVSSITAMGATKVTVNKTTFVADESVLNKITGGFVLSDTAANIQAELSALKTDVAHVSSITAMGAAKVTVNKTTFVADEGILNKITGGFVLSDTAANIQAELPALETDVAHVSSITAMGATKVTVNKTTFVADESVLNKTTGGFVFSDTAANIQAELAALKTDVAHVSSITATGTAKVTVSKTAFVADESVLNKITGGFVLSDTAANFQTELTPLESDVSHVSSVHFTNATPPTLSLTSAVATADKTLLGKITSAYVLDVASAGATVTTGHGAGLTIHDVVGHDTITGGGNDETFVFGSGFGTATITDAAAHWTGASHDVIDFAKSEFASFQALLGDATFAHGAATITKGADHLTLDGFASAAALSAGNTAGDFKFVA